MVILKKNQSYQKIAKNSKDYFECCEFFNIAHIGFIKILNTLMFI